MIKITAISDLHGHLPSLPGGDLLIIAGDFTARDTPIEYGHFGAWMDRQQYKKKIVIAGNHDNYFDRKGYEFIKEVYDSINVEYLCDSGTEFRGMKIWGTPCTMKFDGINPKCCAFTCDTEEQLGQKFGQIPDNSDILISHGPPYGYLDKNNKGEHCGSKSLLDAINRIKPSLVIFGHLHENGGQQAIIPHKDCNTICVNCSIMDELYEPSHHPMEIII